MSFARLIVWLMLAVGLTMPAAAAPAPQLLFTDVVSGPNRGGEDDHGAYLTIYGRGFGAERGESRVMIGATEVAAYKAWSDRKIAVQPGRKVTGGAIRVEVGGVVSSGEASFAVRHGRIWFVALDGNDAAGEPGDIRRPFRNAQKVLNGASFAPGDYMVLRSGTWTDLGDYESRFLNISKDGAPGLPLTITAYPAERVIISPDRGQTAFRLYRHQGRVAHVVISNFDIRIRGDGGCVHLGYGSTDLRIVGNEAQGQQGRGGGGGCFTGSPSRAKILGNTIHDNGGDKLFHALYIDNDHNPGVCDDVEIAYNHIYNQRDPAGSGRGIQIYWEGPYRVAFTNFHIHHNIIHDIDRDGITLGNQSGAGFSVHDNLIYRTGLVWGAGIRFSGRDLEARVFHNTIAQVARSPDVGAIWLESVSQATVANNIVQIVPPSNYLTRDRAVDVANVVLTNNLWSGVGAPPSLDRAPVTRDARFRNAARDDFRLKPGSAAIAAGARIVNSIDPRDLDGVPRAVDAAPDLGAYRYVAP